MKQGKLLANLNYGLSWLNEELKPCLPSLSLTDYPLWHAASHSRKSEFYLMKNLAQLKMLHMSRNPVIALERKKTMLAYLFYSFYS